MTDVVVGVVTFSVVIALLAATLGLLVTVVVAIRDVLAAHGRQPRLRATWSARAPSALLGLELLDPVPPLQATSWWRRLLERADRRRGGRRSATCLLLLPLGVLNLVLVVAAWCGSLALLAAAALRVRAARGHAPSSGCSTSAPGRRLVRRARRRASASCCSRRGSPSCWAGSTGSPARGSSAPTSARCRKPGYAPPRAGGCAAVGSAEAERRRIERDLHDGAQQRLVSLAMELGATREHFDDEDKEAIRGRVVHAHEEAKAALQELRDLVRGIHPVILEDRGLDAALSAVVARAPIPVSLEVERRARGRPPRSRAPPTSWCRRRSPTSPATPAPPTPRCRWCASTRRS